MKPDVKPFAAAHFEIFQKIEKMWYNNSCDESKYLILPKSCRFRNFNLLKFKKIFIFLCNVTNILRN